MTSLEQWGVPLVVLGMLLLMLFMAAVLNRYQTYQADVRAAVRRLDAGVTALADVLDRLDDVPLSQELQVTLHGEILARYQKIRRLYRRYPGIVDKIRAAEVSVRTRATPPAAGVGPVKNEQTMRKRTAALDKLAGLIARGNMVQPLPKDVRAIFCRELGERRAEVLARFYMVRASRFEQDGNVARAGAYLTTLMQALRSHGPSTEFVRELYAEAEKAFSALSATEPNPDSDGVAA